MKVKQRPFGTQALHGKVQVRKGPSRSVDQAEVRLHLRMMLGGVPAF